MLARGSALGLPEDEVGYWIGLSHFLCEDIFPKISGQKWSYVKELQLHFCPQKIANYLKLPYASNYLVASKSVENQLLSNVSNLCPRPLTKV